MKVWVGVTDENWFHTLRGQGADEVNFWQPSGSRQFRSLSIGEPFLFKLHSPKNFIVGGGFFVRHTTLPCSLAWEAFSRKNGVQTHEELVERIRKYRARTGGETEQRDPIIGCNILADPFFFSEDAWIPVPRDWSPNIVQGKSYDTAEPHGQALWSAVEDRLSGLRIPDEARVEEKHPRYGSEYLARARLGQGTFRVLVTDAYERRCAVTSERTLPVLEAAHIKPFAKSGPNFVTNGILLRSDLHKLLDIGLITITPDLYVEVSEKIKEEYENGREYYAYHGKKLTTVPVTTEERPSREFLRWHNEHIFVP